MEVGGEGEGEKDNKEERDEGVDEVQELQGSNK